MEYVLKTDRLTKEYSGHRVVNEVTLNVERGAIYGFVGKNGAGKTTFIRMILGLANPTSGSFELLSDNDISKARRRTGSLIESPALYSNMTALENIRLFSTILGADKSRAEDILKIVGLSDTGKKKARDFSLGMKQRLGIGMALVGDPEFLMLDEPINGLDPTGIVEIRELLLELRNNHGKTIFISSHILGELGKIATNYGIISKGKLVEEITAEELEKKCGIRTVIKTNNSEKAVRILKSIKGIENVEANGDEKVIISDKIENIGILTNELFKNDIIVSGISTSDNGAEKYFIKRMEDDRI